MDSVVLVVKNKLEGVKDYEDYVGKYYNKYIVSALLERIVST